MKTFFTFFACLLVSALSMAQEKNVRMMKVKTDEGERSYKVSKVEEIYFYTLESGSLKHEDHEYVDLGLSVMWATCNVGATSPEGYGDYFAWGETVTKNYFDWEKGDGYKYGVYDWTDEENSYGMTRYNEDDGMTTLRLEDDAVATWGGSWRMPIEEEWQELQEKCAWKWTKRNGVNGWELTSVVNGAELFLPAAGSYGEDELLLKGFQGLYCSSTLYPGLSSEYVLEFTDSKHDIGFFVRCFGVSVRPVFKPVAEVPEE